MFFETVLSFIHCVCAVNVAGNDFEYNCVSGRAIIVNGSFGATGCATGTCAGYGAGGI